MNCTAVLKFLGLGWRNLTRNVKRNLATASALIFGFFGILLLNGYVNRAAHLLRVYTIYLMDTGHIALYKKGGLEKLQFRPEEFSLSPADQQTIADVLTSTPSVERFMRGFRGMGLVGNGCLSVPFIATGVEPAVMREVRSHPEVNQWVPFWNQHFKGRPLWEFPVETGVISLTEGLVRLLGKHRFYEKPLEVDQGQRVLDCQAPDVKSRYSEDANVQLLAESWPGGIAAIDGEVVSQYSTGFSESDHSALLTSTDLLQRLYQTEHISHYAIWVEPEADLAFTVQEIDRRLTEKGLKVDLWVWDSEELSPMYVGTMQFLNTMELFLGLVLVSIVVLSVFNAVTMTVLERSQEIGMLRSLGFRRSHVAWVSLIETFWLSLLSLFVGALIAVVAMEVINRSGIKYHPPGMAHTLELALIPNGSLAIFSGLVLLLLSLFCAFVAVSKQSKKNIAHLLGGTLR